MKLDVDLYDSICSRIYDVMCSRCPDAVFCHEECIECDAYADEVDRIYATAVE